MTIHAAEYWNCSGGANLSSPNNNTRTPCHKTIETIVQEPACVIAIDYTGFAIYCQLNKKKSLGGDLLSQGVAPQVPSALTALTTGFGMGPGVPLSLQSPRDSFHIVNYLLNRLRFFQSPRKVSSSPHQGLSPRPLVQLSSTHYCAYTCCLSSR